MRDRRLDSQKGILIGLVVFGHVLEALAGWTNGLLGGTLRLVYAFHMPAFVYIAGIIAKSHFIRRRVAQLAVTFVLAQLVYSIPDMVRLQHPESFITPTWTLWFLVAMIWWQIALPFLMKSRWPIGSSIVIALAVGLLPIDGYALSISRAAVFLPFFVAGHVHGRALQRYVDGFSAGSMTALATIVFAGVIVSGIDGAWLRGALTFTQMNASPLSGIFIRGALLVAAFALTLCVMRVNVAETMLAYIGSRSLGIYLVHGLIVKALSLLGVPVLLIGQPTWAVLVAGLASSALIVGTLTFLPVDPVIRRIVDGIVNRLIPRPAITEL